jgi:Flp pilus assembly protein TadD
MLKLTNKRRFVLLAATGMVLTLSACQTTAQHNADARADRIDAAIARASGEANGTGQADSLLMLERSYKRNSDDPDTATKYGRALREANRLQRSAVVLSPFADDGKKFPQAKIEYAATQAAMGNYTDSEKYARDAIALNPDSAQAYHVLGIALEAQGHHKPAEAAFRNALDLWEGDPAPVLNNLGLNLAAQGYIDEALDTLRKALATSPNRMEIERNLRIVSALQPRAHAENDTGYKFPPKPARKPGQS